ncbi:energy-coupling factor transporter transmembrane component T family protein [Geomonas ferrireducens]|uniref:energy-coupling factor transporter transmembrane component T family protein n=1 Tax=Geomonas ferrireducens TaxID=2570227 RepID=UPI0010A8779C|nr:energy-coupling factor transporter transmembrane component T [Geomonas ferrireducens]
MQKGPPRFRTSLRSRGYPCRFAEHDSPVHRMGAGWKLVFGVFLSALAAGGRTPLMQAILVLVTLAYYLSARLTLRDLWCDVRLFAFQAAMVIPLYCMLDGVDKGLWPGVRISTQIVLFYLPGAVFLRTTRTSEAMAALRRVVPYRLSFLVFVSVRFVPLFFRELEEIVALQRLRGARLSPREQMNPRNWPDLFNCVVLPLMVRAFRTADEVSRSAEARAFGLHRERTYLDVAAMGRGAGEEAEDEVTGGDGVPPAKALLD